MARAASSTGHTPRPRSSSAATTCSKQPTSTPRWLGRHAARGRRTARSRSGRSGFRKPCTMQREADEPARATAEAVGRRSYGKLISFLAARTRDVAGAEDALSHAFAATRVDWAPSRVPANPEAWLLTVARRRMIDAARRRRSAEEGSIQLQLMADEIEAAAASDAPIPDQRLG